MTFVAGLIVGAIGGGTVSFIVVSILVAASRSDDVDEYRGAREAVKEHLEEQEAREKAAKSLQQWTTEPS